MLLTHKEVYDDSAPDVDSCGVDDPATSEEDIVSAAGESIVNGQSMSRRAVAAIFRGHAWYIQ